MAATHEQGQPRAGARRVRVWDVFVRLSHWSVAAGFLIAYVSEDLLALHVWAGYVVGVLVVARVVWGFVGPPHARFVDFVCPPAAVVRYLANLLRFRARRYLGHSPAGGAMAVALWGLVLAVVLTGLVLYAEEEHKGPLAGWLAAAPHAVAAPLASVLADEDDARDAEAGAELWEEIHEFLAEATLVLVIVHVVGVLWASLVHRENLTRAMIDGCKRAVD